MSAYRILIAHADPAIRARLAKDLAAATGQPVVECLTEPGMLLEALRRSTPRLLVLDCRFHHGIAASLTCRAVRQAYPRGRLGILVVATGLQHGQEPCAFHEGADVCILDGQLDTDALQRTATSLAARITPGVETPYAEPLPRKRT